MGNESLNCSNYGDASSNAIAQSLRKACGLVGLGRQLWRKDRGKRQLNHSEEKLDPYKTQNYMGQRFTDLTAKPKQISRSLYQKEEKPKRINTTKPKNPNSYRTGSREITREEWLQLRNK